jgi:hypothetical protein
MFYNPDDSMHVVGHDDVFIQFGMGKMQGNVVPESIRHATGIVQMHDAIDHMTEQHLPGMGAQRDEIISRG